MIKNLIIFALKIKSLIFANLLILKNNEENISAIED